MSDTLTDQFKAGFRRYPTGVAIVATSTETGPVGATVSSVASVSANPPMLSFSVSRSSRSGPAFTESDRLAVHVLTDSQAHVAAAFADRTAPRFTLTQGWRLPLGEPPILDDAAATFYGRVVRVVPAGEAWLVLIEVDEVTLGENAEPLLHHDRHYWSLGPSVSTVPLDGILPEKAS
ncbi:flavin reductase family protein [Nocardioides sp. KC13]|uniref:Flavin reductase family protein n=1 Tax=Nocardioides turkmenicus TaxID=2711220 RepID=A0A6M1QY54_9ACTN|nr:flavin reductase family protein [Nocardioides sp. KC13]